MHFGENQLSRSLIGLSPLPTPHPPSLQPRWVRASTTSYSRFTLDMGRSPRFGSKTCNYDRPIQTRFRSGSTTRLNLAAHLNSQAHSSKGTPSPAYAENKSPRRALTVYRHMVSGTISLPSRGTFHHSLTVLSTIGRRTSLGLADGPARFTRASTKPALLGCATRTPTSSFIYGTLTHSGRLSHTVRLDNAACT
jgi:hypothetical protein